MTNEMAIKLCETIKGYYQLPHRLQERINIEYLTGALHYRKYSGAVEEYIEEAYYLVQEFLEYEI